MEESKLKKFIYEDNGVTKILKGFIVRQDEFIYEIKAAGSGDVITLGKRAIVKIGNVQGALNE